MTCRFLTLAAWLLVATACCLISPGSAQNYPERGGGGPMMMQQQPPPEKEETSYKLSYVMERAMIGEPMPPPLPEETATVPSVEYQPDGRRDEPANHQDNRPGRYYDGSRGDFHERSNDRRHHDLYDSYVPQDQPPNRGARYNDYEVPPRVSRVDYHEENEWNHY